uniref:Uncharacterized protein n=1 Tax=Tetranychus urticae TaxID=32264 RepID=T1KJS8_TETUR
MMYQSFGYGIQYARYFESSAK